MHDHDPASSGTYGYKFFVNGSEWLIARSVIRSVAVKVTGTLTRSLLGAMGVRGPRR